MLEQFKYINKDKDYVKSLQEEVGAIADGAYGPNTHKAVLSHFGNIMNLRMVFKDFIEG